MEAIILAGGLGTRLRSVVSDVPKCMAPINGIPFIHFIVEWLKHEGVDSFIFSLGYKHEIITDYLDRTFPALEKKYSIEDEPLGTGGAIQKALGHAEEDDVAVINGDTLFNIDIKSLLKIHIQKKAACTIALKEMKNFDRYGSVDVDDNERIIAFREKKYCEKGLINGGVYIVNRKKFLDKKLPQAFSFEKDYLEKSISTDVIIGEQKDFYFIDIGIPEDYKRFGDDYNLIMSKHKHHKDKAHGSLDGLVDFIDGLIELID